MKINFDLNKTASIYQFEDEIYTSDPTTTLTSSSISPTTTTEFPDNRVQVSEELLRAILICEITFVAKRKQKSTQISFFSDFYRLNRHIADWNFMSNRRLRYKNKTLSSETKDS